MEFNTLFVNACSQGDLELVKHLFAQLLPHSYNRKNKWVNMGAYKLENDVFNNAFKNACKNGHLHVAEWLIQNKPNHNITSLINSTFLTSCENNNLQIAKWLFELNYDIDIDISFLNESIFRWACYRGSLEFIKWLLQIKPNINISALDNWAFKACCENNHIKVAKWFCTLKPFKYFINIDEENNRIIQWKIHSDCDAQLLSILFPLLWKDLKCGNNSCYGSLNAEIVSEFPEYLVIE